MIDIHQNYINKFKEIGEPVLKQYGFCFNVIQICGSSYSTEILITKPRTPKTEYVLTFATNHLDYADGVYVYTSGKIVLPKPPITESTEKYAYMGNNLDTDIRRIVTDIVNLEQDK